MLFLPVKTFHPKMENVMQSPPHFGILAMPLQKATDKDEPLDWIGKYQSLGRWNRDLFAGRRKHSSISMLVQCTRISPAFDVPKSIGRCHYSCCKLFKLSPPVVRGRTIKSKPFNPHLGSTSTSGELNPSANKIIGWLLFIQLCCVTVLWGYLSWISHSGANEHKA